jgi:hypothetical protein
MDSDRDMDKTKWVLIAGGLFFVSCFMVWSELMYFLKGREAQATLTEAYEVDQRGRFGRSRGTRIELEYRFTEPDGTQRTGSTSVSNDWTPPGNGIVTVQYTPGVKGRSRLQGQVNGFWLFVFFGSLTAVVVFFVMMSREAADLDRPSKRKPARP